MLIKAGVDISRLNREIRRALPKVQKVLYQFDYELIITSTYEGNHGQGSLHYSNDAFDLRPPKGKARELILLIRQILSEKYDVVLEGDHIHIEYDPK